MPIRHPRSKKKPAPGVVEAKRFLALLAIDASRTEAELDRGWPEDMVGQGKRLHEMALESEVIVNFVGVPGKVGEEPFYVRGSDTSRPSQDMARDVLTVSVFEHWFHVGFRLAYGDQESDLFHRNCLLKAAPDGVERLARWLTPAGQEKAYFLRLGPAGDRHAHIELLALDRYHATFESQRGRAA